SSGSRAAAAGAFGRSVRPAHQAVAPKQSSPNKRRPASPHAAHGAAISVKSGPAHVSRSSAGCWNAWASSVYKGTLAAGSARGRTTHAATPRSAYQSTSDAPDDRMGRRCVIIHAWPALVDLHTARSGTENVSATQRSGNFARRKNNDPM